MPAHAQLDVRHVGLGRRLHVMATALGRPGTPVATISARLSQRDRATALKIRSHVIPAVDVDSANFNGPLLGGPATGWGAR